MGNITDMDMWGDDPGVVSSAVANKMRDELAKLRAFQAAVASEVQILDGLPPTMVALYPKTSGAIIRVLDAFRASR